MISDWTITRQQNGQFRLAHVRLKLGFVGPVHYISGMPSRTVFVATNRILSRHPAITDLFPNAELSESGSFLYLDDTDVAIIKLAAS